MEGIQMSVIDTLIKVKKQTKTDDVINIMDELIAYEKLSKVEAFRDLKTSKVAQQKLPLLSGIYRGDLYSLALVEIVENILIHLDEQIPEVLTNRTEEMDKKEEKRLKILENHIVHVMYRSLNEYDHELMEEHVVAVFIKEEKSQNAIVIIIKENDQYEFFQGYYQETNAKEQKNDKLKPFVYTDGEVSLTITTYSILGNQAYPFAVFTTQKGSYDVLIPNYDELWLMKDSKTYQAISLTMGQRNELNNIKTDIQQYAEYLTDLIRKELDEQDEAFKECSDWSIADNSDRTSTSDGSRVKKL